MTYKLIFIQRRPHRHVPDPLRNLPPLLRQHIPPERPPILIDQLLLDERLHRVPRGVELGRIRRRGEGRVAVRLRQLDQLRLGQALRRLLGQRGQRQQQRVRAGPQGWDVRLCFLGFLGWLVVIVIIIVVIIAVRQSLPGWPLL